MAEKTDPELTGPWSRDLHDVDLAISDARDAANKAGVPISAEAGSGAEGRKASYSFHLSALDDAPSVAAIEEELEKIPGVTVTIVYPNRTAWVTAPGHLDVTELLSVFARHGIRAELSDSTLRRRVTTAGTVPVEHNRRPQGRTRRLSNRRAQEHARQTDREIQQARKDGYFRSLHRQRGQRGATGPATDAAARLLYTSKAMLNTSRLITALVLTIPVIIMANVPALQFPGWQWLSLALSIPVVTWCAWPFHRSLIGGVRRRRATLDTAGSLATIAAMIWSIVALVFTDAGVIGWRTAPVLLGYYGGSIRDAEIFIDVACGIVTLLLLGRRIFIARHRSLATDLARQFSDPHDTVHLVERNRRSGKTTECEISVGEINVGDDILVDPGQRIPVDGIVIGGGSTVLRGAVDVTASAPGAHTVSVDDEVVAGSRNLSSQLKIRTLRTGHKTSLAAAQRWVYTVNRRESADVKLAYRSANMLVRLAVVIAVVGGGIWAIASDNLSLSFGIALTVLAGVAPAAVALSVPHVVRSGLESAARSGLFVRSGEVLRHLEEVDTVIFNRVGTLSWPVMGVDTVTPARGENSEMILRVAGALARESEHPASRAIVRAARESRDQDSGSGLPRWLETSNLTIDEDGTFHATISYATTGDDGRSKDHQITASLWRPLHMSELTGRLAVAASQGGTPIVVRWNGVDRGVITLHDKVKDDAADAVDTLEEMGLETVMLSRDTYPVARFFADRIGIARVLAGIPPARKHIAVRAVHTRGANIAMIGDSSVTDCMRVADVGVLVGDEIPAQHLKEHRDTGIDAVVLRRDVGAVADLIKLARRVTRIGDSNLHIAWIYNVLVVIAALAGLLHPMVATGLMLAVSLFLQWRADSLRRSYNRHRR